MRPTPIAIAEPLPATPTASYHALPEPTLRIDVVAFAVPAPPSALRWPCRQAALVQMTYFFLSLLLLNFSLLLGLLGLLAAGAGYFGSGRPIDGRRRRALFLYRLANAVLLTGHAAAFIYLAVHGNHLKSLNIGASVLGVIGGAMNMAVLWYGLVHGHRYYSDVVVVASRARVHV